MTQEERLIRLEIGAEILENAILDFLKEKADSYFSTAKVSQALGGFNYHVCHGVLERLYSRGSIFNNKASKGGYNRWKVCYD